MTATYEIPQATGASAQIIYCKESDWGVSPASGYRKLNVVAGESLDDSIQTYQSQVIRADRMRNPTVRGTRRPGGSLPIELAPQGISQFIWHVLGSDPVVTAGPSAATSTVQTLTIANATGGTFKLIFNSQPTAPIAYNAAAADIQSALEAITDIGAGNVTVTGPAPFTITFLGGRLGGRYPAMKTDVSSLVGAGANATVTVTSSGTLAIPAGKHRHVIKGYTSLPTGFTIEKGFKDLATPKYFAMKGCRVNRFSLNGAIDAIVTGTVDIMAREMGISDTSVAGVSEVAAAPVSSSFTSIQAGIYKDGVQISVCQSLSLNIDNGMQEGSFVLGSNYRQNLKPGSRSVDGEATFLFQGTEFYEAAVKGDNLSLAIRMADDWDNSVEFLMPKIQLLPNNSSPKIASDGPLTIPANFQAVPDDDLGSDIQATIVSDETAINY
jgi:hypothetical protein